MAIENWMRPNAASINPDYVGSFINDHERLGEAFDPDLATSKDHAAALTNLNQLYGLTMEDGALSDAERGDLADVMGNTNGAFADAYYENLGAEYGVGVDVGYYGDAEAEANAATLEGYTATGAEADPDAGKVDGDPDAAATEGAFTPPEPNRAADGRIIYDGAPSADAIAAGEANLHLGQKGETVTDAQQALLDSGAYEGVYPEGTDPSAIADNFYGPKTEEAVRNWQKANGHEETGFLDAAQYEQLLSGEAPVVTDGAANPAANPVVTDGAANPAANPVVTDGAANPAANPVVTDGAANPAANPVVTDGAANPAANPAVTDGAANPAANPAVTDGAANPAAAPSFRIPPDLAADLEAARNNPNLERGGHAGRTARQRLERLEGRATQEALGARVEELQAEIETARAQSERGGHAGRTAGWRLERLEAELAQYLPPQD